MLFFLAMVFISVPPGGKFKLQARESITRLSLTSKDAVLLSIAA